MMWSPAPAVPLLEANEVHVWRASLDATDAALEACRRVLSEDERERAGRFFFEKDGDRFVVARGLLRQVLGRYLNLAADRLEFRYSPNGKPSVAAGAGGASLGFNLSHSQGVALLAAGWGRAIGVDIEAIRSGVDHAQIARQFFSPNEVKALLAMPPEEQQAAFYRCWTRKEAYVKARGEGLSFTLDGFDVAFAPGEPAALLHVLGDPDEASRWSLRDLEPGPEFAAALAVEGRDLRLQQWQWAMG